MSRSKGRLLGGVIVLALSLIGNRVAAQPFTGVNQPGAGQDFGFTVGVGATNLSLSVSGTATAYSHLFLRKGAPPTAVLHDYAAVADNQGNALNLQLPELTAGDYVLRVFTPAASTAHSFSVSLATNQTNLRTSARPATKPLAFTAQGSLTAGTWHYYRVDLIETIPGWRLDLNSPSGIGPEVYVQRGSIPTTGSFLRRGQGQTNDLIVLAENELPPGAYYVGVYFPPGATGSGAYTLQGRQVNFSRLTWDPGLAHEGAELFTSPSTNGGDYYFRITTENTSVGAWRTALKVLSGEADVYMTNNVPPTPYAYQFRSARVGSDGFVVPSTQFQAGQDWYLLVRAAAGSEWSLVSGEAFVQDLGSVAADGSSGSGSVEIGPEGYRFFRTTVDAEIPAWRLWLNGATNTLLLRKTLVPLVGTSDLAQASQMLVVPPYLTGGGLYYVAVSGEPGRTVQLDSREQPVTDIPFASTGVVQVEGFGYSTYRVQIPVDQLSWQVTVAPTNGNANVAVRRSLVPNEANNDAYSEVAGLVADSITLVPPVLSDGTFYITVYGTNAHAFTLTSGEPVVTDIGFTSRVDNDDPNRVGWRYYRVTDIDQQLGSLGWELVLQNHVPGTRIALRRNAVPSAWSYRNVPPLSSGSFSQYDVISESDFLQRPAHQADVWYVGVYNPTNALGNFRLVTRSITATSVGLDGGSESRAGVLAGRWQFFQFDVPTNILGWDLRLTGITSGSPQLVVRRDLLPVTLGATNFNFNVPVTQTNWPSGSQWVAGEDWSDRDFSADGSVDERGRTLTMSMGRPLEPGTYYVGVLNRSSDTNVMSYTLLSRGIGLGQSLPVEDLAFAGGSATRTGVSPREPAFFRVQVPTNAPSWKVRLGMTEGDALLVVARDRLPNISASVSGSATNLLGTAGRKMSKLGNEHFLELPLNGRTHLFPGTYYLAVVPEGTVATNRATWIGTGTSTYSLQSIGPAPEIELGLLSGADLVRSDALEGGESLAYHFQTLPGTLGFEISLRDRIGNPVAVSYPTRRLPDPGASSRIVPADPYGNEGGVPGPLAASPDLITVADPFLDETITVKARYSGQIHPDASYTLRVRQLTADPLGFDGGAAAVVDQTETLRFFRVEVPVGALGWEVRLTSVQGGNANLIISRDYLGVLDVTTPGFSPGLDTNWFSGEQWYAGRDWTQRSFSADGTVNEDGRILAMGLGRPLEPGTYYVSVRNPSVGLQPISYTIESRGIGDGFSLPVVDLPYDGGSVTNTSLGPRQAAYFRTVIPEGAPSWRVKLTSQAGEMMLLALTNSVPSVLTGRAPAAGRAMQKPGGENFLLIPGPGETALAPITNYLAVVGEGLSPSNISRIGSGDGSFTLTSRGALPVKYLGIVSTNEIVESGAVEAGDTLAYQFAVPEETVSLQLLLGDRVGNPTMVLRFGAQLPAPGAGSTTSGVGAVGQESPIYGYEGGYTITTGQGDANGSVITMANPTNGLYTLLIKARALAAVHTNASFTLRIAAIQAKPLPFDGGSLAMTNQPAGVWQYFQVIVPPDAVGWDLRLLEVSSGTPKLIVRRDTIPFGQTSFPWGAPGNVATWPSSNQWAASLDWTRRAESPSGVNESGRLLAMGLGRPLEPGTYYVGVVSAAGTAPLSYRLVSRGIGGPYAIPVRDLAFNGGTASRSNLGARDVDYYRVTVPSDIPGWKVKLSSSGGEVMLLSLSNSVPNVDTGQPGVLGRRLAKPGNEHYVLLPPAGQALQPGGTYYLAVVGEGLNPTSANRVGAGDSSYQIQSQGALPVVDLGVVGPAGVERAEVLEGGELRAYQFSLAPGSLAIQATLDNRVGNPVMAFRTGNRFPNPGMASLLGPQAGGVAQDDYGHEGGDTLAPSEGNANQLLITQPNATNSTFRLVVKARATAPSTYPNSAYTLRVQAFPATPLNFSADQNGNGGTHTATGLLSDNQRAFYRVEVPSNYLGQAVLGWRLDLAQSQGTASLRVRRGALPSDAVAGMGWVTNSAVIAPDYLTNGTWYVEVRGSGSTRYTLTSRPVALERPAWGMPGPGQPVTTPGLASPFFGDTGVDTNGNVLPLDQGVDLEAGYYHFYAVQIPTNNSGLLRTELTAISGNPDLYIRADKVPTLSHSANGSAAPPLYDRLLNSPVNTEYGNWVPLNGKTEVALKPGTWYLAVRSSLTANARYRLRVSTGGIQDLALNGGSLVSQVVVGGDWRYYRVVLPAAAPANWTVAFSQQAGNVDLFIRDTVPPGNGATTATADFKDWSTDGKNAGPYPRPDVAGSYTFTLPPLRPGTAYYLGFRAVNDATFSVSSSTSGASPSDLPSIAFYGGAVTNEIPPNSQVSYKVYAPADARRWIHTSQHPSGVQVFIEQGTLPSKGTSDDFRSTSANSTLNKDLYTAFPWLADRTYYLTATNTTAQPQTFALQMDGRNALTDDYDRDSMPDIWELTYFNNSLAQPPNGDFDADGVLNLAEYIDGTNPADRTSVLIRVTLSATNGVAGIAPVSATYPYGSSVTVSVVPNPGYEFSQWSGSVRGTSYPLTLTLTSNVTITAICRVPGDDFVQRRVLAAWSNQVTVASSGATKEGFEPYHAGNSGGKSLWWSWTPTASGPATVTTAGSSFNTLLAVYTGTAIPNLVPVASNDNASATNTTSRVQFNAVAGTTYAIAVDGLNGTGGTVVLQVASDQQPLLIDRITLLADGQVQIDATGEAGRSFDVEASTNATTWELLGPVFNNSGSFQYTDSGATNHPNRFYRILAR